MINRLMIAAVVAMAVGAGEAKEVSANAVGRRTHNGSNVPFSAWAPDELRENAAVYVLMELPVDKGPVREVFERMMKDGTIPPGIVIRTTPGVLYPTQPGGRTQYMRAMEYDRIGRDFPDFIVEDLVPYAAVKLGVTIDPSPERHLIGGCSSGGLAAWNIAWYRNDFFHRAFLSSPTFSAIAGGEEPMTIVRKCEPRPLKVYLTCGTREPDFYFGNSYYVARNAEAALRYAGYDYRFEEFLHEGHGARRDDPALWERMLPWFFEGWRDNVPPAVKPGHQRLNGLFAKGSRWTECDAKIPAACTEVRSVDGWRVFSVSPDCRSVVSEAVKPDGSRCGRTLMGPFHLAWNSTVVGAKALAVLESGRLLAATELGVQAVVPFGIVDVIVPLPGDLACDNLAVIGRTLYAASGGRVFRRELAEGAADATKTVKPTTPEYWDGKMICPEHRP